MKNSGCYTWAITVLTLQQYSALTDPEHFLFNHYIYILFDLQSYIEGYSNILGISTYLRLNLTMTQIELLIKGNFLDLIKAEAYLFASYSTKWIGAQFYVKVTVDLKAINSVSSVVKMIKVQLKEVSTVSDAIFVVERTTNDIYGI